MTTRTRTTISPYVRFQVLAETAFGHNGIMRSESRLLALCRQLGYSLDVAVKLLRAAGCCTEYVDCDYYRAASYADPHDYAVIMVRKLVELAATAPEPLDVRGVLATSEVVAVAGWNIDFLAGFFNSAAKRQ